MLHHASVAHPTLRGPSRPGAGDLDEGPLTAAVVAAYAREDGSGGQAAAEAVLPARRALWRLAEVHLPTALAASLRARLSSADQTGRGGVRELRRALADWLDPPPVCAHCRRPIDPDLGEAPCPARPQRVPGLRGRRPAPTPCTPPRGTRPLRGGAAVARDVVRCGALPLFSPLQLDPACAAAARLTRHGAAAYDLVVDRDARTLLEVTAPRAGLPEAVAAARRRLDLAIDRGLRANGPLILKCQLRQYSPSAGVTRSDLVQGAALGCRRALLDYDPAVARFSTYAIHWIRQGGGDTFAERSLVAVPDWAAGLRRAVEEGGLEPERLLALIGTVAETRPEVPAPAAGDAGGQERARRRAAAHSDAVADLVAAAGLCEAVVLPAVPTSRGVAGRPARTVVPAASAAEVTSALKQAARCPARTRVDPGDESARTRVAAVVTARRWLRVGAKDATGGALLTALRCGTAVVVGVATGDRGDDNSAEDGGGRPHRRAESLVDEAPDPEEVAAEEDESRSQLTRLHAALEALRLADPEAAEVMRRRHALDGLGDPETLEEIAAAPLRSTGRSRCREWVRQAYERGRRTLQSIVAVP